MCNNAWSIAFAAVGLAAVSATTLHVDAPHKGPQTICTKRTDASWIDSGYVPNRDGDPAWQAYIVAQTAIRYRAREANQAREAIELAKCDFVIMPPYTN